MKYNYKPLQGICKTCLGCYRLEQEEFKGIWRCEYYIEEAKDEQDRNTI